MKSLPRVITSSLLCRWPARSISELIWRLLLWNRQMRIRPVGLYQGSPKCRTRVRRLGFLRWCLASLITYRSVLQRRNWRHSRWKKIIIRTSKRPLMMAMLFWPFLLWNRATRDSNLWKTTSSINFCRTKTSLGWVLILTNTVICKLLVILSISPLRLWRRDKQMISRRIWLIWLIWVLSRKNMPLLLRSTT